MSYSISRVAVIGAGTMGAGIAALVANTGIPVHLLDIAPDKLTSEEEAQGLTLQHPIVRNRIVNALFERAQKLSPPAFVDAAAVGRVTIGNLEDDLERLGDVDWIVEVIVENLAIKQALMASVERVRRPGSIVTSNTSGIRISKIAANCSQDLKAHFLGTHFFNPPFRMKLLELIPSADTSPEVLAFMREFGERTLGKGIVVCKDTPNFIANRISGMGSAFARAYAVDNHYSIEEVDSIVGPLIGRPKTGLFRLSDLVGLDLNLMVGGNLYEAIPEDEDREVLRSPNWTGLWKRMIDRGWLGNKTGQGFYKAVKDEEAKREFWVLNIDTMQYAPPRQVHFESLTRASTMESLQERLRTLFAADDRAGRYVRAILSFNLSYASRRVPEIADSFVELDKAMKWGFAHEMGPFEIWDALGVAGTIRSIEGQGRKVAPWVEEMVASGRETFYQYAAGQKTGYYDLGVRDYRPLS